MCEFVEMAFRHVGLDWQQHVAIDPRYFRPTEVDFLQGDPRKAREQLGWRPRVGFSTLVAMMVDHDRDLARQENTLKTAGYGVTTRGNASSQAG